MIPRIFLSTCLLLIVPGLALAKNNKDPEIKIQNADYYQQTQSLNVKGKLKNFPGDTVVGLIGNGPGWIANLDTDTDGNDNFDFTILLNEVLPPCSVQVEAGGQSASTIVKHGSSGCDPFELTFQGLVVDDPIPFAAVSVTIGGVTYTTVADENGAYSIDIASILFDNLVLIEADFADNTDAELISIGSFAKYLDTSDNGVVTEGTNVTNVTSAMFLALVQANGGTPPSTVQELVEAETHVDATQVLETAAVIKMILDGGVSPPPGCIGLSLLSCVATPGVTSVVISENPALFTATVTEILGDNDLVQGFDSVPARYYSVAASRPGFLPRGGELMEFGPGASNGELFAQAAEALPEAINFNWSIVSGVLFLDLIGPPPIGSDADLAFLAEEYPGAEMDDGGPIGDNGMRDCTVNSFGAPNYPHHTVLEHQRRLTRIADGVGVDTVSLESRGEFRDFDSVECSDGAERTPETILYVNHDNHLLQENTSVNGQPFTTTLAAASWALTFYYDFGVGGVVERRFGGDVAALNGDGSVAADTANSASWSWSLSGDDLLLDYGDGWTQRMSIINSLDPDGTGGNVVEYLLFSVFEGPEDKRYATSDIAVQANPSLMFSEASLVNDPVHFWNGMVNAWQPSAWEGDDLQFNWYFGWRLQSAGGGGRVTILPFLECDMGDPLDPAWGLSPFSDGGMPSEGWTIDGSGNLAMPYWDGWRTRTWKPLQETVTDEGIRILYVFEMEAQDGLNRFPPRINIQWELSEPTDVFCEVLY